MNCIEPTLAVFPTTGRPRRCARNRSAQRRQRLSRNTRIPCTFCAYTQTHTQIRFMSHRSPSPPSQGPNGPIGPTGPPGSHGSTGPKVSCLPRWQTPCSAADSEWNLNFDDTPVLQGDPGLPGPPGEKVRPLIQNSLRVPWWDIFGKRLRWSKHFYFDFNAGRQAGLCEQERREGESFWCVSHTQDACVSCAENLFMLLRKTLL